MKNTNVKGTMLNRRAQMTMSIIFWLGIMIFGIIGQIGEDSMNSFDAFINWFKDSPYYTLTLSWLMCSMVMSFDWRKSFTKKES